MNTIHLGNAGAQVSPFGLGCMGMSGMYGPADEAESRRTIDAALEARITFFDTGDFYGMGHNEMLLGSALKGKRKRVFLSVKFGGMRAPSGEFIGFDGRPAAVKNFIAYSLKRLGTDYLDLYQPARIDPSVPYEETIGAVADLIKAGYVRYLGVSEVGSDLIRRAHAVHPVTALQVEYSLLTRDIERDVLPTLRELGIGLTAYGVLSRGLIADQPLTAYAPGDFRGHLPCFTGENREKNDRLVTGLRQFAASKGITVAQLAFGWVAQQGEDIVPLIGTTKEKRLHEALAAAHVRFGQEELAALDALVPLGSAHGDRYMPEQMRMVVK